MKRKKKRFKDSSQPQSYHIIGDLNTGRVTAGLIEDLTDDDLFDDCPLCQQLKLDIQAARARNARGSSAQVTH